MMSSISSIHTGINPIRTRASKPKAKTGCLTCKVRKVKCGEERPGCLKCAKLGRACSGYKDVFSISRAPTRYLPNTQLLPKAPVEAIEGSSLRVLHPTSARNMSENDRRYFHFYRAHVISRISGGYESTLWGRIVLQACEDVPIRNLAVAIAAINQHSRVKLEPNVVQTHRIFALQKYSQALQGIRSYLSTMKDQTRFALLAALLIFVFEASLGDMKLAFKHVQSAVNLIHNRLSCQPKSSRRSENVPNFATPESNLGRTQDPVESEIVQFFTCFDRPSGRPSCGDSVSLQSRVLSSTLRPDSFEIPAVFKSLQEARHSLQSIRYGAFPEHRTKENLETSTILPDGAASPAVMLMWLLSELRESEADFFRAKIGHWHQAFTTLLHRSQVPKNTALHIETATLSIQGASLELALCRVTTTSSDRLTIKEESHRSTRDLLARAKELVSFTAFKKSFVYDIGIIPSLWIVIVFCSDVLYKKEALVILKEMQPRVECVWDSRAVALAGEGFINMVEKSNRDIIMA